MLVEHRSRIRASSAVLDACSLKRNKRESIALAGSRDAILNPSTRVGMTRPRAPSVLFGIGNLDIWSVSRAPARRTLLELMSFSKTARGDMSPPYSFTNRSNDFPLPAASAFGFPLRVRNRRSVSHPCTTRSTGMRVVRVGSKLAVVWLSIRLISFLGKPVRAATFE